jgi:hypothetical protein|tara:strand:- start:108 stop:266 length:159 start_codon:yes stop_codon:yes gene_type:complete
MPWVPPFGSDDVIIVTPVANRPQAFLNSDCVTGISLASVVLPVVRERVHNFN